MPSPRTNSPYAWVLAARPKTLTAACVPVIIASALAYRDDAFKLEPALLCLLFALLMQIAANLINDLIDFVKGTDRTDRLGPERACAQGWITLPAMRRGIALNLLLASLTGLLLLRFGNPFILLAVGLACLVFVFLYTTLFSYCGLGDLLVLVFFGLVPVNTTYYLLTSVVTPDSVVASCGCGFLVDTLLVVNNYRDYSTDLRYHKHTLITLLGPRFGQNLYLLLGLAAFAAFSFIIGPSLLLILPLLYIPLHILTWRRMLQIGSCRALNSILALNSRNMILLAVISALALVLGSPE